MTRDELLAALTVERYDNRWWKTRPVEPIDDDLTCARRRRQMAADFEAHEKAEREAR